ncbi:hypothetical protein AVEN_213135-1 [Araneus ventricosus]|uniref:Uncharacterized protein n=1 Tax=Araneus ventricosus TaxID=182803 RepID=A0A4Y2RL59_ARAVE|nr:hypothetical protein AVEN_213135-1 [Araneus ventricosus]
MRYKLRMLLLTLMSGIMLLKLSFTSVIVVWTIYIPLTFCVFYLASAKLRTRMTKKSRQNLVSKQTIRRIVILISENRDLFQPPSPSTFQREQQTSSK